MSRMQERRGMLKALTASRATVIIPSAYPFRTLCTMMSVPPLVPTPNWIPPKSSPRRRSMPESIPTVALIFQRASPIAIGRTEGCCPTFFAGFARAMRRQARRRRRTQSERSLLRMSSMIAAMSVAVSSESRRWEMSSSVRPVLPAAAPRESSWAALANSFFVSSGD